MNRDSTVHLQTGVRLQWEPAQSAYVLLYPEGMVQLNGPAGEIMARCDGRTVAAVIADLEQAFPEAELAEDVLMFLDEAVAKGWLYAEGG
ncbi:pyrroloquinoline quinone biosynthesis peptide chaperone PqqD [Arhodomonas sp. SL1]|uniref:pyrroloquinoline quinone biosynthesis peptide chaperone PqqD n=1 Tax=Arhodomonas sp. SL1 TaxID=3425691 RepID=UPI003F883217